LQQVGRRLLQLREEPTREQARLHAVEFTLDRDGLIAADLRANIRHLQKRLQALQQSAAELAAREPSLAAQVQRLRSVPGIGELRALNLLGELLARPPPPPFPSAASVVACIWLTADSGRPTEETRTAHLRNYDRRGT